MLERLHVHLAHLKREGQLISWTDEQIPAGGNLDATISRELNSSQLFIALLSPDYLASNYCYESEFRRAVEMHQAGKLTIVPIIIEPCDWLNTPFSSFKALPMDGKAVSTWENNNTAFLNITQSLRKLLERPSRTAETRITRSGSAELSTRNYRIKKDFDSIEVLEFKEKSFKELTELLRRYTAEINSLENIKARVIQESISEFKCMLVNRNKIAAECLLHLFLCSGSSPRRGFHFNDADITFKLDPSDLGTKGMSSKDFVLAKDDYHLYWKENNLYFQNQEERELSVREMADLIWEEWLESVGIEL